MEKSLMENFIFCAVLRTSIIHASITNQGRPCMHQPANFKGRQYLYPLQMTSLKIIWYFHCWFWMTLNIFSTFLFADTLPKMTFSIKDLFSNDMNKIDSVKKFTIENFVLVQCNVEHLKITIMVVVLIPCYVHVTGNLENTF